MPGARVLALNSGSSSLKFALYDLRAREEAELTGAAEEIGRPTARVWMRDAAGHSLVDEPCRIASPADVVSLIRAQIDRPRTPAPDIAAHRVVFGGDEHVAPERVTPALLDDLRRLSSFAPLHLPPAIHVIERALAELPSIPHVACFDTAFHAHLPDVARRLPIPAALDREGIRRYGFHGLSYEFVVSTVGAAALGRSVIAHLGNGVSLAAVRDGCSVDTTMGFSPTGGVMMSTRSGDLDPGVIVHLAREKRMTIDAIERLLTRESGLTAVSETTGSMQTLLAQRAEDPRADLAIRMFCDAIRKQIGAFAATLNGLDTLVFTGGIGEHAHEIRAEICATLEHLGIAIDADANARSESCISTSSSACRVHVVVTNENLTIARHAAALVTGAP